MHVLLQDTSQGENAFCHIFLKTNQAFSSDLSSLTHTPALPIYLGDPATHQIHQTEDSTCFINWALNPNLKKKCEILF